MVFVPGAAPAARADPGPNPLERWIGALPTTLRFGTPAQAGLLTRYADEITVNAAAGLAPGTGTDGHSLYPGEVVLAARNGVIAEYDAQGYNLRYADPAGNELPRDQWIPTTKDTIYDVASLSKLFTSIVAMQLLERGRLDVNATVASYLPEFAQNGKQDITVERLLTHTSGLPPDPSPGLWTHPTYDQRIAAIYATKPQAGPGTAYVYSDVNMITLQLVEQKVSGKPLDVLVHDGITGPLHMDDTMYNPPAFLKARIAAGEYELSPDRGLVWGQVHDENAWALGGVAGHAGVFSTAYDLAVLLQTMLNGGSYGNVRILSKRSVVRMLTNDNRDFPGNEHGLGFELWQYWYMGAMATPYAAGHTGFTGTSLVMDPATHSFVILLTNRIHPSREWGSTNAQRQAVGDDLARAVAVSRPRGQRSAWFGGMADATTATLTVPLDLPAPSQLNFDLWYDTEPGCDFVHLEASSDGGATWSAVPFTLCGTDFRASTTGSVSGYEGRQWLRARADLSSGSILLRWRYATDSLYHGRGVYVDEVRVLAGDQAVFDDRRPADTAKLRPVGWVPSPD